MDGDHGGEPIKKPSHLPTRRIRDGRLSRDVLIQSLLEETSGLPPPAPRKRNEVSITFRTFADDRLLVLNVWNAVSSLVWLIRAQICHPRLALRGGNSNTTSMIANDNNLSPVCHPIATLQRFSCKRLGLGKGKVWRSYVLFPTFYVNISHRRVFSQCHVEDQTNTQTREVGDPGLADPTIPLDVRSFSKNFVYLPQVAQKTPIPFFQEAASLFATRCRAHPYPHPQLRRQKLFYLSELACYQRDSARCKP